MAEEKGTGRHPHKNEEEPYPHHESGRSQEHHSASSERHEARGSEASDLKAREYRDKDGNIHHHTRTSAEYRAKKSA